MQVGKPDFREGQADQSGQNWKKTVIFLGKSMAIVLIFPWKDRDPLLHVLDLNSPSFYVKCSRKCQKTYNFKFFQHFPKFTPLPLLNFGVNPKFDHILLCVYY